jgi:hypothetical protein
MIWAVMIAAVSFPRPSWADTRIAPEFSLYMNHDAAFRSRVSASGAWSDDDSEFVASGFEYDLDVSLGSFFRRYLFKDPNIEKSKFVTLRIGYAYLPEINSGDDNADEQRLITDATFRLPIAKAWLLSDRNRVDFRHFTHSDLTRYRNRLRVERNVKIERFRMTPYIHGEAYYDGVADDWNQMDATAGAEFPWRYKTILEINYTRQMKRDGTDNDVIGLEFQKHL